MVERTASLNAIFHSLSDPTRRDILRRVARRPLSVSEVAKVYERHMSLAAVSKHLQVLERARLITKERAGRTHVVRGSPAELSRVEAYLEECRRQWEERLDRLEAYLEKKNYG